MLILGDDDHFRSKTYLQNYFLKVLPFQSDLFSPSFHYIAAPITLEPPLVPSNQGTISPILFSFQMPVNGLFSFFFHSEKSLWFGFGIPLDLKIMRPRDC